MSVAGETFACFAIFLKVNALGPSFIITSVDKRNNSESLIILGLIFILVSKQLFNNKLLKRKKKMTNIVFIATSLDGYIADKNGGLSWLDELPPSDKGDFGFNDFMMNIDAIVMGRNTYEKILSFDGEWPYVKKVFVLSNTLKKVDPKLKDKVEIFSGHPNLIISRLSDLGFHRLYIDGGKTIQSFLKENLIDEIHIFRIPIILADGIPLFKPFNLKIKYKHIHTTAYKNGIVQSHYIKT